MVAGSLLLPPTRSPSDVAPVPVHDDDAFVEHGSHAEVSFARRFLFFPPAN